MPVQAIEAAGCENVFQVGQTVISGGEPATEEAFRSLAGLGVKTIISVDGARPNLEWANRHGMRYVHLPIGYEGIDEDRSLELARAVRDLDGPVYVHCHHGKHRGPAAVAVALIGAFGWSNADATAFLQQAGTSEKYIGLYDVVRSFSLPAPDALNRQTGDFPEVADRSDMVEAMAAMDRQFDNLALAAAVDFRVPRDHPDIDPKHEALQLAETFRELLRTNAAADWPDDMRRWMTDAGQLAHTLERELREGKGDPAGTMKALRKSCTACHDDWRNNK